MAEKKLVTKPIFTSTIRDVRLYDVTQTLRNLEGELTAI